MKYLVHGRSEGSGAANTLRLNVPPAYAIPFSVCGVVLLFSIQLWASDLTYRHGQNPHSSAVMIAAALPQTAILLFLYRALSLTTAVPRTLIWLAGGTATMVVLSLGAANPNPDAAAYVGYAKLPHYSDAYAPPVTHFSGNGFDIINEWGPQLPALVYGPLWLLFDRLALGHAPTFAQALFILRALNLVFLFALVACLPRFHVNRQTIPIVALNPALFYYFVVQAHNDLIAILLIVVAMVLAERRPWLGAIVAGSAGLVKITFAVIAMLAFAGRRKVVTLGQLGIVIAITVVGSLLFGGRDYLYAMMGIGHGQLLARTDILHMFGVLAHICAALIAGIALVVALATGIFVGPAAYSFSAISTIMRPWYLGWCIPYVLRTPNFAASFFISLPALMYPIDQLFPVNPAHTSMVADAYYLLIIGLVARHLWMAGKSRRETRSSATTAAPDA